MVKKEVLGIGFDERAEPSPEKQAYPLDDLDGAILEAHQRDTSIGYSELAQAFDVTTATVRNRIRRLKEAGVMDLILAVNPHKLGLQVVALIAIQIDWADPGLDRIVAALRSTPNVVTVMVVTGRYDVFVRYVSADLAGYRRFISEELPNIEGITKFESFIELELDSPRIQIGDLGSS